MLCPETWNFKPAQHYFSIDRRDIKKADVIPEVVKTHYFNHSASFDNLVLFTITHIFVHIYGCVPGARAIPSLYLYYFRYKTKIKSCNTALHSSNSLYRTKRIETS